MNKFEEDLKATLDEWALKGHGIALTQINAAFFIQILRSKGYEIIHLGEIQKVRHEHNVITSQVLEAYRQVYAAKQRIEMLQTQKDILQEILQEIPEKGKIIGTCGHDISEEWEEVKDGISIMEFEGEDRVVAHCMVCKTCRADYEKEGIVLHTRNEEKAWLAGELKYPEKEEKNANE